MRPHQVLSALLILASSSSLLHAAPPPAPANVRAILLPAEVMFTWDASPGADYYQVYRGGPNRRWVPLGPVTEPRFRDTDFVPLPGYYQIAAFNNAREVSATAEFLIAPATASISLIGVTPRPVSDTSFAVAWTINGPQPFAGYGRGGGGDGMLEVGLDLDHMMLVGSTTVVSERHEFVAQNLQPNTTYFYRLTSAGANNAGFTYVNKFTTRAFVPLPPAVLALDGANPTLLVDEDMPGEFTCTAGLPGQPLDVFILGAPSGMVWGTSPNFTYLSNPEHPGQDYFDCAYTDGVMLNFTRVSVTVRHVEDPPIAEDFSLLFLEEGGGKFFTRASGWDFEPTQLDFQMVSGPTNGTITREYFKSEFQYRPGTNFAGIDHFSYRAFDGDSTGNVATVRIYVSPINDAPIARSQSLMTTSGVPQVILLDASEPDGEWLQFSISSAPAHGTLTGPVPFVSNQYTYTPAAGYTGADSFTWAVVDSVGSSATATVSITVFAPPVPTAPSSLIVTVGPRARVDLSWADNASNESGFRIERSLSATSGWVEIGSVGSNVRSFASTTGQKSNKTYYFRVRAFNASGTSAYSNTASAKARK